ncbi:hypothetical protein NHX12_018970 [Muraenolepis orangiensis]|uniref:Uncharacterized protein n=1 Tax=Muraenolepis orangiensis TaxID=630683 RepID=A0A9Q0ESB1_9TELE|nr:hypothetical protein NHX12_018970 [Muraenolepis orangiensis]
MASLSMALGCSAEMAASAAVSWHDVSIHIDQWEEQLHSREQQGSLRPGVNTVWKLLHTVGPFPWPDMEQLALYPRPAGRNKNTSTTSDLLRVALRFYMD